MFKKDFPKYKMTPMEAARREEHYILRELFYKGWLDVHGDGLSSSGYSAGSVAVRLASPCCRLYDCWVPDPDDEDCALHLLIDEVDLEKRLSNSKNLREVLRDMGCFISEFKEMPMCEKLYKLCSNIDIIDFLNLEDVPEGTPWNEVKLQRKVSDDILRVKTLDDSL